MGRLTYQEYFPKSKERHLKQEFAVEFGKHVRKVRKEKGLTQEELAFKTSLHSTYIGHIETGTYTPSIFMDTNIRNNKITELLEKHLPATETAYHLKDNSLEIELEKLFNSSVWGFREILLVIVVARFLDSNYKASSHFYDCNPRALYEGPIRTFLLKHGIPHKKSGPLNVAKATIGINSQWAAQRRPSELAKTTVKLVETIEGMKQKDLEEYLTYLLARFVKEAIRVLELTVNIEPESDPSYLYDLCRNLIQDVPDAGNTPQRIIGLLLKTYHDEVNSEVKVIGYEDRASVTSTTSKKPGDLTEELSSGEVLRVYEITVKPFGPARVDESFDTVNKYDELHDCKTEEIIVICRKEDCHPEITKNIESTILLGRFEHEDITYYFIDIYEWIMQQLLKITFEGRACFYKELANYIANPNTAEKIKLYWKELHENLK